MSTTEMNINAPTSNDFANINANFDSSRLDIIRNDDIGYERVDRPKISSETGLDNPNQLPINIYRYKFTQDFMDDLHKFSKIHQYDDRKVFKEAWESWIEENGELIQEEMERLENLNYDGDVLDKMFKRARYYFRKKSPKRPEPKNRRQYLSVQKDLLDAMDKHILKKMKEEDYKPSDGFTDFCESSVNLLQEEVTRLVVEHGISDASLIKEKIKKTYKNRYFILVNRKL
jgi:hypothetical protein